MATRRHVHVAVIGAPGTSKSTTIGHYAKGVREKNKPLLWIACKPPGNALSMFPECIKMNLGAYNPKILARIVTEATVPVFIFDERLRDEKEAKSCVYNMLLMLNMKNGSVICDDWTEVERGLISREMENVLVSKRQCNFDLITVWHDTRLPPRIWGKTSYVILHQITTGLSSSAKGILTSEKIAEFEAAIVKVNRLVAEGNAGACEVIELRDEFLNFK